MLHWLANRLILKPSTQSIDTDRKRRRWIAMDGLRLEVWQPEPLIDDAQAELVVLKFPGTAGRAERVTYFPLDIWPAQAGVIWSINYPGYGGSEGRADIRSLPGASEAFWNAARVAFPSARFVVSGNSLGSCMALYVTARYPVDALILRNPPPVHQLIRERARYNWWNFGIGKRIAAQFPDCLDALRYASRSRCPALLIQSEHDSLVPVTFQNRIRDAYAGPLKTFVIPDADHQTQVPDALRDEFRSDMQWLHDQVLGPR
jgi:pimeloyl-ACP methyl ester carboxylesterase